MGIGISKALLASGGMQRNITLLISPVNCPYICPQTDIIQKEGELRGNNYTDVILQLKPQHNAKLV